MSNPGGLSGGFIGGGGGSGGGTSFAGVGNGGQLIDRRFDHVSQAINTLSRRITDLEEARDEKVEPYDVMDSFRATKPDAGEPVNQHYINCLKQNVRLIEENDVLRYQYEAMKNETALCNEQLERLQKTVADKQKVLEDTMDARDRYIKQIYAQHKEIEKNKAIMKCIDIVERIKNDTLTVGEGKRWMVAICEDIQQEIKKEFGVK